MKHILISAIICTHNRAGFLTDALTGLAAQTLESEKFEILVIDNASGDDTPRVVEAWRGMLKNIRYIFEPNLGLSNARNRGIREACAPIVAYLDDDAIPEPQWLKSLLDAYDEITPPPVAVGGKILLQWHGSPPPWLDKVELLYPLGLNDQGDAIIPVKHVCGGNMSFRKGILLEYGGFDPRLGRRGNLQFTSEESELQLRMRADGHVLYYQPSALVWHQIDVAKQHTDYLLRRFFAQGQSDALRYFLNKWPGRFEIVKLALRQLIRRYGILFRFYEAIWVGANPPSAERYYVKCKWAELLGFQITLARIFYRGSSHFAL